MTQKKEKSPTILQKVIAYFQPTNKLRLNQEVMNQEVTREHGAEGKHSLQGHGYRELYRSVGSAAQRKRTFSKASYLSRKRFQTG